MKFTEKGQGAEVVASMVVDLTIEVYVKGGGEGSRAKVVAGMVYGLCVWTDMIVTGQVSQWRVGGGGGALNVG